MMVKYWKPRAITAPTSSSGTTRSFLRSDRSLTASHQPATDQLVRHHHRQDQEALHDDDDLPGQVGADGDAILPPEQQPEEDGSQGHPDRIVPTQERHGDAR